jgi:glyoxylate reductase
MRYTVVLTADFPPLARDLLAPHCDVIAHPTEHDRSEDDLITMLAEADAAITLLSDPITRRVLASNPHLRIVSNFAVGTNNIDVAAARELGIRIGHTPGVLTDEIRTRGRCEWEPLKLVGPALRGLRLGIVGMGRIGSAVATRARAFGMEVAGIRRGEGIDQLLETSDIISLHAPLDESTHHLIGAAELSRMSRGSYLINTARGPLVDESALCDALERGHLGGAGLDVFEFEPRVDDRLLRMRNVVILPHIGSATDVARNEMARIAATNALNVLHGMPPLHEVT